MMELMQTISALSMLVCLMVMILQSKKALRKFCGI